MNKTRFKAVKLFLVALVLTILVLPLASAITVPSQGVFLPYVDGTSIFLAGETYSSINRTDNVWYVNGQIYQSGGGGGLNPTPTPTPSNGSGGGGGGGGGGGFGDGGGLPFIPFIQNVIDVIKNAPPWALWGLIAVLIVVGLAGVVKGKKRGGTPSRSFRNGGM